MHIANLFSGPLFQCQVKCFSVPKHTRRNVRDLLWLINLIFLVIRKWCPLRYCMNNVYLVEKKAGERKQIHLLCPWFIWLSPEWMRKFIQCSMEIRFYNFHWVFIVMSLFSLIVSTGCVYCRRCCCWFNSSRRRGNHEQRTCTMRHHSLF